MSLWLFVQWKKLFSHFGCGSCFLINDLDYESSLSSYWLLLWMFGTEKFGNLVPFLSSFLPGICSCVCSLLKWSPSTCFPEVYILVRRLSSYVKKQNDANKLNKNKLSCLLLFLTLFFFPTNMLSFLCLVTIPASQCLLTRTFVLLPYYEVCTFQLGFSEWGEPTLLAWLGHCSRVPSASLEAACRGRNYAGSDPSVCRVLQPCSGSMSRTAFVFWDRLLKFLLPSSSRGCISRAGSALPAPQQGWPRVPWSELRAFPWSRPVKVRPFISTCWVWPSACTHQGWADNCTQRKTENRL